MSNSIAVSDQVDKIRFEWADIIYATSKARQL